MRWFIIRKLAARLPRGKSLLFLTCVLMALTSLGACSGLLSRKNGPPSVSLNCFPSVNGGGPANPSNGLKGIKLPIPSFSGPDGKMREQSRNPMLDDVNRITALDRPGFTGSPTIRISAKP